MLHLINIDEHKPMSVKLRFGELQLVALDEGVLIDLQSRGYDTLGQAYRQHACDTMSVAETLALRDTLTRMLAAKLPKQSAA